jgi:DNA polymerase-3 subunit delta'
MATGGSKAVKELEKEQKSRATRMVRDSIDGALLDLATFYRDVLMVQSGNLEWMINTDMRVEIERYASSNPEHSTILKINALMDARANLARNAAPMVTCEALMCQLAKA